MSEVQVAVLYGLESIVIEKQRLFELASERNPQESISTNLSQNLWIFINLIF